MDGIGPDGREAGWGGGAKYGANGMLLAADVTGCCGWYQDFEGYPGPNGDCSHLADQLGREVLFAADKVFWCGPLAVHKAIPMRHDRKRSLVRLSMPSDCPWYEGYTRNPLGVEPTGPVHPARTEFMAYRPLEPRRA